MVRMFIRWCFLPGALRHFSFPQFGGGVQGEATGQSESLTYTVSLAEQWEGTQVSWQCLPLPPAFTPFSELLKLFYQPIHPIHLCFVDSTTKLSVKFIYHFSLYVTIKFTMIFLLGYCKNILTGLISSVVLLPSTPPSLLLSFISISILLD